jgi:hypothetical protein
MIYERLPLIGEYEWNHNLDLKCQLHILKHIRDPLKIIADMGTIKVLLKIINPNEYESYTPQPNKNNASSENIYVTKMHLGPKCTYRLRVSKAALPRL